MHGSAISQTVTPLLVEADATEFKATLTDGRVLRSRDLIGARLVIAMDGRAVRVRIDGVDPDPEARNGTVWLHTFSVQMADGSWENVCAPGPDGRRQGFPIAGRRAGRRLIRFGRARRFASSPARAAALGKCVRFGYPPWAVPAMLLDNEAGTVTEWSQDGEKSVRPSS